MKKALISLAIAAAFAACHNSGKLQRKDQQQYDVVQEGQASGVTSTINAPGEVVPPPAPMTGTNADTTSNFTLPQVSTTGAPGTQPGTIAGTLPQPAPGSMNVGYPTTQPPQPRTTTHATSTTQATPQTAEPRRATEPRTDTAQTYQVESAPPPPPPTSTVSPNTDTAPPPPPSTDSTSTKNKSKDKDNPPSTDTQPPPATTTT